MLEKIKRWVRNRPRLYHWLLLLYSREERVQWKLRRLINDPQKHVDFFVENSVMCGYGTKYPRTLHINLSNPKYFNEKLLWLKYYKYNNDPIVAKCCNKYLVRQYVEEHGYGDILNTLYGVWDRPEDIPWEKLPEKYILKDSNGSGHHVRKQAGEVIDGKQTVRFLKRFNYTEKIACEASGDLFANNTKQYYICEKFLDNSAGSSSIADYKFYCFDGTPRFLLYIWDRKSQTDFKEVFKRIDWDNDCELIDQSDYFEHAMNSPLPLPKSYHRMLEIAKNLSEGFPFVRVDLYDQDGKVVFGEMTFVPAAGHVLYHVYKEDLSLNTQCLEEMGDLIKIDNKPKED